MFPWNCPTVLFDNESLPPTFWLPLHLISFLRSRQFSSRHIVGSRRRRLQSDTDDPSGILTICTWTIRQSTSKGSQLRSTEAYSPSECCDFVVEMRASFDRFDIQSQCRSRSRVSTMPLLLRWWYAGAMEAWVERRSGRNACSKRYEYEIASQLMTIDGRTEPSSVCIWRLRLAELISPPQAETVDSSGPHVCCCCQ